MRTVAVRRDIAAALSTAKVRLAFDAVSFTRRKEHVEAVVNAKRAETRAARVARVVASLRAQ